MNNIFQQGAGMLIDDEIAQSTDPSRHARDIVNNLALYRFRYACLRLAGYNELASVVLRDACRASGKIAFTTWDQHTSPADQIVGATRWKSEGHFANTESPSEEQAWSDNHLDALYVQMNGNVGNIVTEGPWGKDKAKAKRWVDRGYFGMFEAIESENSQITIHAMADVTNQLGSPVEQRGFCIYLTRGYPSKEYTDMMAETHGRWAIFRYGDVDREDWVEFSKWPRVEIAPVLPGIGIMEGHRIVTQALAEVNKRQVALGRPPLGANAALVNAAASSQAALNLKWTAAMGAKFARLRESCGI